MIAPWCPAGLGVASAWLREPEAGWLESPTDRFAVPLACYMARPGLRGPEEGRLESPTDRFGGTVGPLYGTAPALVFVSLACTALVRTA